MIEHTMPSEYAGEFRPNYPFPEYISETANAELDQLSTILENEGIKVYRPKNVDSSIVHMLGLAGHECPCFGWQEGDR